MANPLLDDPDLNNAVAAIKGGKAGKGRATSNPLLGDPGLDAAIAAVKKGQEPRSAGDDALRQVGLTARYGIEGAAAAAGAFTDPVIDAIGGGVRMLTGGNYDPATLSKLGRRAADAIGLPSPETTQERVVGALARGVVGGAGAANVAGQVANRTTGAVQSTAAQLAANPAMQAIAGGGAGTAGQVAQEAGAGPVGQIAASLAGGFGAGAGAGLAQKLAAARGATINPAQQAILDAGKEANVPVMTSDVLPPNSFMSKSLQSMGERIPVAGTGPVRAAQQTARADSVADIAAQYGKPDYEAIVGSLKGRVGNIKKAAGRVINQAGQQLDAAGPVAPVKATQTIDNAIAELTRPEVYKPGFQGYVDDLTQIRDTFQNNPTYTNLRETRTALREVMESVDPTGRSQLPSRTKALFAKTYSALKDDMDDFARANLQPNQIAKLDKANIVYGETAGLLKNTRLKNVLDKGDVKPEVVKSIIFNGQPSEMKTLYDSLGTSGRQNVRSALIDEAASKSVLADGGINPNRFGAELAKYDKKIDAFFKGDERESIKGLTRLMQVTRRAQDSQLAPTNGSSAIPYALGAGAIASLGKTLVLGGAGGGLARLYESAPVRDLLLKLNATTAGSRQEGDIIRTIAATIQAERQRKEQEKSINENQAQ